MWAAQLHRVSKGGFNVNACTDHGGKGHVICEGLCSVSTWRGGGEKPPEDIKSPGHDGGFVELRARIRNKFKQVTDEWEWAKNFCKALKEGWRSLFSRDQGGVRCRTGGWVDGGSQMSGSGVSDRGVKGGKVRG